MEVRSSRLLAAFGQNLELRNRTSFAPRLLPFSNTPQHPTAMSTIRACGPRAVRLNISTRHQTLRRFNSTSNNAAQASPAPPRPQPSLFRRNRARITLCTLMLGAGALAGGFVSHTIAPPPLPAPGTHEDSVLMADLNKQIDEEFKVKVFRGKCLGVSKQLKGAPGGWVEIVPQPVGDQRIADDGLIDNMQGARGLGVERVFFDRDENKLIAICWFGGSLSGWPGVTHGGVLATLISDKMALTAALAEGKGNVSAAAIPQRMPGTGSHAKAFAPTYPDEPASMSFTYKKPSYANNFFVIRVQPLMEIYEDGTTSSKHDYEATLESLDAKVCIQAKAKFGPTSTAQQVEEKVIGGAQKGYSEFRDWMWPSRQKNSQLD